MQYHGLISSFNNVDPIEQKYAGSYVFLSGGPTAFPGISLGAGVVGFAAVNGELKGTSAYFSVSAGLTMILVLSLSGGVGESWRDGAYRKVSYVVPDGRVDMSSLVSNLIVDIDSPAVLPVSPSNVMKFKAIELASRYAWIYNEIHVEPR